MLLGDETFSWPRFATAAALGVVATYSFANGILFWPIGFAVLLVLTVQARERIAALESWIVIAALTLGAYFYDYHKPEEHPPLTLLFRMPGEYLAYLFKYLGGIGEQNLCGDPAIDGVLALLIGLAGTATLGWAGWMLVRSSIVGFRTLIPYLAMSLYSVGGALITGVGRLGFGSDQALASRYCTMVTPLWVSLVVFLFLLGRSNGKAAPGASAESKSASGFRAWNGCLVARGLLGAVLVVVALGSAFGVVGASNVSRAQAYGRDRLLELAARPKADTDTSGLLAIYPVPSIVVERYPVLVKYQLSLFHDSNSALDSGAKPR